MAEAVIVASCPEVHHDEVAQACRSVGFQKAFGRMGDMLDSLSGTDWAAKWEVKVVMATCTLAGALRARKAKILCIQGGKFCDLEFQRQPALRRAIKQEMCDESFKVRVEWMEMDDFREVVAEACLGEAAKGKGKSKGNGVDKEETPSQQRQEGDEARGKTKSKRAAKKARAEEQQKQHVAGNESKGTGKQHQDREDGAKEKGREDKDSGMRGGEGAHMSHGIAPGRPQEDHTEATSRGKGHGVCKEDVPARKAQREASNTESSDKSPACESAFGLARAVCAGRYAFPSARCVIDPFVEILAAEGSALNHIEISKLKGQVPKRAVNARLLVVSVRYIVYAMQEGQIRVISQNGQEMFKLTSNTRSTIIDLAISSEGTAIFSIDEAARVSIYRLDGTSEGAPEERARRWEVVFPNGTQIRRVLGHPLDSHTFLTMHGAYVHVWSFARLTPKVSYFAPPRSFTTFSLGEVSAASVCARPPSGMPLLDLAVSVDGACLLTLGRDGTTVTAFDLTGLGATDRKAYLSASQEISLGMAMGSLRTMGSLNSNASQLLIAGSKSGCEVHVHPLSPSSGGPVGALAQALRVNIPAVNSPAEFFLPEVADEPVYSLDVESIARGVLVLAFADQPLALLLPLARDWAPAKGLPLPYAQRFPLGTHTSMMAIMRGRSAATEGHTAFLYRCRNTWSDSMQRVLLEVDEVRDGSLIAHESAPDLAAAAAHEAKRVAEAGEQVPRGAHADAEASATGATADRAGDKVGAGAVDADAADDAHATCAGAAKTRSSCVQRVAEGLARDMEQRRGELAKSIANEVARIVGSAAATAADMAALEQALGRLQARPARDQGVKSEASWETITAGLHEELARLSDDIAASAARRLARSLGFGDAFAQVAQRSGGSAKAPLGRGSVGSALTEGLKEPLTDVFRQELRQHFREELAPELARVVGCATGGVFAGAADSHETASGHAGSDSAPAAQAEPARGTGGTAPRAAEADTPSASEARSTAQAEPAMPTQGTRFLSKAELRALREEMASQKANTNRSSWHDYVPSTEGRSKGKGFDKDYESYQQSKGKSKRKGAGDHGKGKVRSKAGKTSDDYDARPFRGTPRSKGYEQAGD